MFTKKKIPVVLVRAMQEVRHVEIVIITLEAFPQKHLGESAILPMEIIFVRD